MSNSKIEEEQKQRLIQNENLLDDNQNEIDIRPFSSRVKKVLEWKPKKRIFELEEKHIQELRQHHIKNDAHWNEFEGLYKGLSP